jgi:hypothetical protein
MTLGDKQRHFAQMVAWLIFHAEKLGYAVTLGDAYRDARVTYGHPDSLHRKRLAIDLNLFKREDGKWVYQTDSDAHEPLGVYFESIGGAWGGRWGDGNHYSLEHDGMK